MAIHVSHHMEEGHEHTHSKSGKYWRGILSGMFPLAVMAVIIVITLALAALIRQRIGIATFLLQQQVVLITLCCGLALALIAFTLALISTLRRVAKWQRNGPIESAQAALWTLVASRLRDPAAGPAGLCASITHHIIYIILMQLLLLSIQKWEYALLMLPLA